MKEILILSKNEKLKAANSPGHQNPFGDILEPFQPKIRRWILRILIPFQGYKEFIKEEEFSDDDLAHYLGLDEWLNNQSFCRQSIIKSLEAQYETYERHPINTSNSILEKNLLNLKQLINLNEIEHSLLEFFILLDSSVHLYAALKTLNNLTYSDQYRLITVLLGSADSNIRTFFSTSCLLERSGLLVFNGINKLLIY